MSNNYHIYQFDDSGLAHYSYAIVSDGQMALIDPSRDPQPYYDHAKRMGAQIVAVIETHPHADFVSSHLEISATTGAKVYVSKLLGATYNHVTFDDGDVLQLGSVELHSMNTPGHSPDSISILLVENGKRKALFSGDTLFVGDVGRPDLREKAGNITAKREELARMMYNTVQTRLKPLDDSVEVYPAHGAGSLCGKALSSAASTTIGAERLTNYAFRNMTEDEFVLELTSEQPHIPKYFGNSVGLNRNGAPSYEASVAAVKRLGHLTAEVALATLGKDAVIIDVRPEVAFKAGHIKGSINIQNNSKFDTWLGTIFAPTDSYYIAVGNAEEAEHVIRRAAFIGYESAIKGVFILDAANADSTLSRADLDALLESPESYTIIDVRNENEARTSPMFAGAINIPLHELQDRIAEVPVDKPIMVHCAAGYRSAAGSSIIARELGDKVEVHDIGESIKDVPVMTA
jgi:glyoxylase-like metal-dependent hydrolase (beta-lactamase superfamily II)/rhodanese-related sulfurtransferase